MHLGEPYSGMERDPDEQQHIVEEMTALIAQDPSNAQAYFRRGNALSNLRHYALARQDLARVIALEPGNALAYNNRGIAALCTGNAAAAIADLCQAIALDPTYRDAYHNRGLAYSEVGKLEEAIADLSQAIALDPACAPAYADLSHRPCYARRPCRQLPGLPEDQRVRGRRVTLDRVSSVCIRIAFCV